MKKLFFFRSSANDGNVNDDSPSSTEKQVYWEAPFQSGQNNQGSDKAENNFRSPRGLFSKSSKKVPDKQNSSSNPGLRRSRSFSSAAFLANGLGQQDFSCTSDRSRSPLSSTSNTPHQQFDNSSCRRALTPTPERQTNAKQFEVEATQNAHRVGRPCSSKSVNNSSGSSSSSNVSSKVLDRYIDGEEHEERSKQKISSSQRYFPAKGNSGGRLPPRVQYTAPTSPTDSAKEKARCHSFRDAKATRLHFTSKDWVENGFAHESPRSVAKQVIERLSKTHAFPKSNSKEFDRDIPITIEDIYGGSLNRGIKSDLDFPTRNSLSPEEYYEAINSNLKDELEERNFAEIEDALDVELRSRSKEAEEMVVLLSDDLERESFLQDGGFDMSSLIRTCRTLTEDKISLAIEVSGLLKSRIAERDSAKEELKLAKADLDSQTRRLEKEKNELQSALEKELDRRSCDWSLKLEKYQLEEQRLRGRVRELAEQNVSLQREVSSFNERETESQSVITYSEQRLRHLSSEVEELNKVNEDLKKNMSKLQENYTAAAEDLDCMKRSFEDKDMECNDLQKSTTRLLRTCREQEKTIEGLRNGFSDQAEKRQPSDRFDKHVEKLQMEQMRLTGVELALRREIESYRLEFDSLRHENINLLNRLKGGGKEMAALTFKLDEEMWTRIYYLQNQGLSMLKEISQLCSKLLEYIKGKSCQLPETKQGTELVRNGLDRQFIVESDIKIQGFKRASESLMRSLQNISSLLQEKSNLAASKLEPSSTNVDGDGKQNHQTSQENLRAELKAETLLTSLLREKLYSKELEVEQMQAELATAVRGNDILRSEVQNAMDDLSCLNHKSKDLELQMRKKDEYLHRLQSDLQECMKELAMMKGILPKITEERDMMWEEVKQYNEKNMLLNSEVNSLKKKVEDLEEDILLKEGQITILKDTLGSRPYDLLATSNSTKDFFLE